MLNGLGKRLHRRISKNYKAASKGLYTDPRCYVCVAIVIVYVLFFLLLFLLFPWEVRKRKL